MGRLTRLYTKEVESFIHANTPSPITLTVDELKEIADSVPGLEIRQRKDSDEILIIYWDQENTFIGRILQWIDVRFSKWYTFKGNESPPFVWKPRIYNEKVYFDLIYSQEWDKHSWGYVARAWKDILYRNLNVTKVIVIDPPEPVVQLPKAPWFFPECWGGNEPEGYFTAMFLSEVGKVIRAFIEDLQDIAYEEYHVWKKIEEPDIWEEVTTVMASSVEEALETVIVLDHSNQCAITLMGLYPLPENILASK